MLETYPEEKNEMLKKDKDGHTQDMPGKGESKSFWKNNKFKICICLAILSLLILIIIIISIVTSTKGHDTGKMLRVIYSEADKREFLKDYKPINGSFQVDCTVQLPDNSHACWFDKTSLQGCDNPSEDCALIVFNKDWENYTIWKPEAFAKDEIKEINSSNVRAAIGALLYVDATANIDYVFFDCTKTPDIKFWPATFGFHVRYWLNTTAVGYRQPIVALKFEKPKPTDVKCRFWAKNSQTSGDECGANCVVF